MSLRGGKKAKLQNDRLQRLSQESQDSKASSQNSQNSKIKTKNFSKEETAALYRCTEKFHAIINKNSNKESDKAARQRAWTSIKNSFDQYCKSQGIHVS